MGTRARVEVFQKNKCIVSIYCQFDGYPSGLGKQLAEFLSARKIVNGIGRDETAANAANGLGCLAAQLVRHLKADDIGSVYLDSPMEEDGEAGEEFVYRITQDNHADPLLIQVAEGGITFFGHPNDPASFKGIFSGSVSEFADWCAKVNA